MIALTPPIPILNNLFELISNQWIAFLTIVWTLYFLLSIIINVTFKMFLFFEEILKQKEVKISPEIANLILKKLIIPYDDKISKVLSESYIEPNKYHLQELVHELSKIITITKDLKFHLPQNFLEPIEQLKACYEGFCPEKSKKESFKKEQFSNLSYSYFELCERIRRALQSHPRKQNFYTFTSNKYFIKKYNGQKMLKKAFKFFIFTFILLIWLFLVFTLILLWNSIYY